MNPSDATPATPAPIRIGPLGYIALYLVFTALLARTLALESIRPRLPIYLAGELLFLGFYTVVFVFPRLPAWFIQLVFALQSVLALWLISLRPEFDFLILFYFLLSAQAALIFRGRLLWAWITVFVLLSAGSLIYFLGLARGLALSLTTIAADIVIPAYFIVLHENELARRRSQVLLAELQTTNQSLQVHLAQAADLSALEERNRLARALHDTTSQLIFSISLTARAAQLLLETHPDRLSEQLARLESQTGEALAQLRSLITRLRPPQNAVAATDPPSQDLNPG